jgi:hypothetical protein
MELISSPDQCAVGHALISGVIGLENNVVDRSLEPWIVDERQAELVTILFAMKYPSPSATTECVLNWETIP